MSLEFIGIGGGVIDRDYIGEIKVVLFNHHPTNEYTVQVGDKIAQMVLEKVAYVNAREVEPDDKAFCGARFEGFGSSGK